jgi:hypothetical protein
MSDQDDEVYLSAKHIRDWKAEFEALTIEQSGVSVQINSLQKRHTELANKIQSLRQKLHLAIPFSPSLGEWIQEKEFDATPDNVTLTDAILKAIVRFQVANRNMLQQNVQQFGYPAQKLQSNPNYLYIALKRLKDRKFIEEAPPDQFRLTSAGQAEAAQKR